MSATRGGEEHAVVDAAHLEALVTDSLDLAAVVGDDLRLTYLNRAGRRLLLLTPDDVGSPSLRDLVAPRDADVLSTEALPAIGERQRWAGTLTLRTAAGIELPTRSILRQHVSPDGARHLTWVARDISTEQAVYERLHRKIFEEELTGLPHRSVFLDRLDMALRPTPDRTRPPVALLFLSLDRFKEKNDRFGREVGDELLRAVARRLDRLRGPSDTVSRWGGDEFVIMREGVRDDDEALGLAHRARDAIAAGFVAAGTELYLSASIGVAVGDPNAVTTDEVLRHAEAAGQMAKQRGGGSVHLYDDEMRQRALRRAEVEDALRGAVHRRELVLHFQPEVSLRSNEIVAVEALVRWQHPSWGLVAPGEFIPVAETSHLILEVGDWVLHGAMAQIAEWREQFPDRALTVSINISARQFGQDDFVERVARALETTGAEPADVCLEITESVLMEDVGVTGATLRRLKALGLQLAVDDFGTGYSSLSYLRRFPVDVLKVDQSFVRGLGHDPEDSAIVRAVVHMGRALRLTTVAEGVGTAHQLIELRELGCEVAQGYHFCRPRPAEAVTQMLHAGMAWPTIA